MNVIQEDFVKGLIGMPMAGPSARLDVLHVSSTSPVMSAYNHVCDRMSRASRVTRQATFPPWSPISCIA